MYVIPQITGGRAAPMCVYVCVFIIIWMYECEYMFINVYPMLYFIYLLCLFYGF